MSAVGDFYKRHRLEGRNDHPASFALEVIQGDLQERLGEDYEGMLLSIWSSAEWPESYVSASIWQMLFEYGDRSRLIPKDTPDEITLYRGSTEERSQGMSWTDSLETAEWFARRFEAMRDSNHAYVYEITVPKKMLIAKNDNRSENEWIINSDVYLDIQPKVHKAKESHDQV